jgi:hypothetical protein
MEDMMAMVWNTSFAYGTLKAQRLNHRCSGQPGA